VDEALYRLHAQREETYWWWVGKNRIILSLIERFGSRVSGFGSRVKTVESHTRNPNPETRTPTALDIGCGAGGVLARLSQPPFNFDAVGVDMSPIARELCAKRGLRALDGSLPDKLPFTEPESFDVIVMSEVIEHVQEDRASVVAAARLLRKGGIMVCTVPAHMWLWSSHDEFNLHKRRYTRAQFGALFEGLGLEKLVLSEYQAAALPLVAGARWMERVRKRVTGRAPTEPTVRSLPRPVNWMLTGVFEMEKHWLPRGRLPWGTSVIGVYRRPA
jgi:SAM-dependent methyltransferase